MRRIGVFALVVVAGCSLVWDMDPYDATGAATRDGGSSGDATSSSSGGNASSASSASSSGSGGESTFDAGDASILEAGGTGFDATAPGTCGGEDEPNDGPGQATDATGSTICGTISTIFDDDYFGVVVEGTSQSIYIELGANVRVFVEYQRGGGVWSQDPGPHTTTLPNGLSMIRFEATGAQPGGSYILAVP